MEWFLKDSYRSRGVGWWWWGSGVVDYIADTVQGGVSMLRTASLGVKHRVACLPCSGRPVCSLSSFRSVAMSVMGLKKKKCFNLLPSA